MTFNEVVSAAIKDLELHGYDSQSRVDYWAAEIRKAAEAEMLPETDLASVLTRTLTKDFSRAVEKLERKERNVATFTLRNVKPDLRAELDRRISASASLIKLNREAMMEQTMRRFRGWATSIPAGGSNAVEVNPVKQDVKKALRQLPFTERRVMIDQGFKLVSAVNEIAAVGNGAIAMVWDSRWRMSGYDYRKDHKERDGKFYVIRGSWADEQGLIKHPDGYADEITKPGEEVFCRCSGVYKYTLSQLPSDMLTKKGAEYLDRAKETMRSVRNG